MAAPLFSPPFGIPITDQQGNLTVAWREFFNGLFQRSGGASGGISGQLDGITNIPGSTLYRAAGAWQGINPGPAGYVFQMVGGYPQWSSIGGSAFPNEPANNVFAGPATGPNASPAFRTLVPADLSSLNGQIPGTGAATNASAGNIGEYISSTVASGAPVALTTTVIANITSIALTAGDWDVWGSIGVSAAPTTSARAWLNTVSATDPGAPNGGSYLSAGTSFPLTAPRPHHLVRRPRHRPRTRARTCAGCWSRCWPPF